MVNVGFPKSTLYGFEMVDGRLRPCFCGKPPSIENLHRIDWFEFFTNFRRFNLNANTCDLSTAGKSRTDYWRTPPVAGDPQYSVLALPAVANWQMFAWL